MAKKKLKTDPEREQRISYEVVVDAYGPEERAMGWYYYLEDRLAPFTAKCVAERAISPLRVGDEVEVIGTAPGEECEHEIFVMIRWDRKQGLGVPLSQLAPIDANDETREAVEDWHYWASMGYEF